MSLPAPARTPSHPALTAPATNDLIERKLRSLLGCWGITRVDLDDIRQELYLDLLERLPKHDPARSPVSLFVTVCVHRKIYNLIRARRTRHYGPEQRFLEHNDDAPAGGPVQEACAAERTARIHQNLNDLCLDLKPALAELPEHLHAVAIGLMSDRARSVAAVLGIPHDRVYRHVREIQAVFAKHGLGAYAA
ncbi:MAG: sigma-70 family RNA polymerase sigma factor [Planctomycetes bacterium]|nr:sigma-70 family RNA polymerase sigma factor [Planctomycetota bacterium]